MESECIICTNIGAVTAPCLCKGTVGFVHPKCVFRPERGVDQQCTICKGFIPLEWFPEELRNPPATIGQRIRAASLVLSLPGLYLLTYYRLVMNYNIYKEYTRSDPLRYILLLETFLFGIIGLTYASEDNFKMWLLSYVIYICFCLVVIQ
jgi:hypothetical protein